MKYPYHFKYSKLGSPLMQLPEGMELVTLFLYCEVEGTMDEEFFLEEIERVVRKRSPSL